MVKNRGLCFFKAKNPKKVKINSNFAEFSRTPQWSENQDQHLKVFLEGLEFFSMLGFFKTDIKKKLLRFRKMQGRFDPPLGGRGLSITRHISNATKNFRRIECIVLTPQTNEVMVKSDFDGRENAKLCIIWTFYCPYLSSK